LVWIVSVERYFMADSVDYDERVTSARTEALFIALTLLFAVLLVLSVRSRGMDGWGVASAAASLVFLFYTINYQALLVKISSDAVRLQFGLFRREIPRANIERAYRDPVSLWRIGGAGIHFSLFGGRYRAMFNVLEFPRIVLVLKHREGPVAEIAFSTRNPDEVLARLGRKSSPGPAPGSGSG
jgi:hypothetical protein